MPFLQHINWLKRLFSKGANRDVRPELLADGYYTDADNMRPTSITGDAGAMEALRGEELRDGAFLPNGQPIPNADTYVLIGAAYTNGHDVGFWASTNPSNPPLIRIDGTVMAYSPNIPYRYDRPLQIAVVDQCRSGVLYPADDFNDPLFWDIQAIITAFNNNTGQFFGGFNVNTVLVGLNAPPSFPVLDREEPLIDLGGSSGLPVGQYAYCIRWVTANGDRTNWGLETPLIPVPAKWTPSQEFPQSFSGPWGARYPGMRTYGGETAENSILTPTQYAINLRIRIDNQYGYSSIEIKRRRYNDGSGLTNPGIEQIVGRIAISPGQNNIIRFRDTPDAFDEPETIGEIEAQNQVVNIKKPKAVDYSDGRLKYGNFELANQDIGEQITFREVDGRKMTSVTKALQKLATNPDTGLPEIIPDGYTNPYNATYYKSARRGEKYGYGIQCWDGGLGKYPTANIPGLENYAHPNRRDIKGANGNWGADSLAYSDDPIWAASVDVTGTNPEGPVTATFDVMNQGFAKKTNLNFLVNVQRALDSGNTGVYRNADLFTAFDSNPPGNATVIPYQIPFSPFENRVRPSDNGGYAPWRPTGNADGDQNGWGTLPSGWNIPPVVKRLTTSAGAEEFAPNIFGPNYQQDTGYIFSPTYQALGGLLYGVENIPETVQAFTVVRTPPAGRVIMQGFGSYRLTPGPRENNPGLRTPAQKTTNTLVVHFPEEAFSTISQAIVDDLEVNPDRYAVQLVAPYGFYTEQYGYNGRLFGPSDNFSPNAPPVQSAASLGLDMISYGRISFDNGQVNAGEPATGMGVQRDANSNAPDRNYVGFDMWRAFSGDQPQGDPNNPNYYSYFRQFPYNAQNPNDTGGNVYWSIANASRVSENCWSIRLDQGLYAEQAIQNLDFQNSLNRRFYQPWYVVNIIDRNAETPNANIVDYVNTGCHIKMQSCIGVYTNAGVQDFELLDERWQDCVNRFPTDYRYVYVQKPNGEQQRWLNFYGNTQVDLTAIITSLNSTGEALLPNNVTIYGLCECAPFFDGIPKFIRIGDPNYGPPPEQGSRIIVKYDPTAPIEVFGHDIAVAPSIHAVMNFPWESNLYANDDIGFRLNGLGMPHPGFAMNPRYFIPKFTNETEQNITINWLHSIRQWCVMWDCETKLQPAYFVNATSTPGNRRDDSQFFPAIHYVLRSYRFGNSQPSNNPAVEYGFFPQYNDDYPDEGAIWLYGGLRFKPGLNPDYAKQPDIDFKGFPKAGYSFNGDFCTGIIASTEFDPLNQDSPGLRTFLYQNLTNISNENGEIKLLATALGPRGQNQYAFTQKGVCVVLTNKYILSGADGEQIATQSISNYWGEEIWITRNIGLPDQFWRLFSKGHAPAGNGFVDTMMWPDRQSWYTLRGDTIQDIARNKYLSKLGPVLRNLPSDYTPQMSAFYNPVHHEMWASIRPKFEFINNIPILVSPRQFFVYSVLNADWVGSYDFNFDGYLWTPRSNLGMRLCETYELERGFQMNGEVREASVMYPVVGAPGSYKEAVRSRIVGDKPDAMELYDKDMNLMVRQSFAEQEAFAPGTGNLWIKRYDSWELFWNRVSAAYNAARPRPQDEFFYVKIVYNTPTDKYVTMGENQLKNIK
jgi:hypothetical protein